MFGRFRWQRLGLLLAGVLASSAVVGCSLSALMAIPDPANLTQAQTGVVLPAGGMGPGNIEGPAAPAPTGATTSQYPATGLSALARMVSSVNITGCVGPNSRVVPDLTKISLALAQSTLLLEGLQPGNIRWVYSDTVPQGNVISQDPAAGKIVKSGTAVDLLTSLGQQLSAMPDVVGRAQADAQTALTGGGFTIGSVSQAYSNAVAAGNVISQDPAAGTLVPPNASVNLVVSQGPQPVAVPNVLGMTQADAEAAIVAAGFSVGVVGQGSSATVPAGIVMSQNPVADVMMPPGTAVDFTVSKGPQSVAIPNVAGRTQSDAQATLTGAGFSVGNVTQVWSATVPKGTVVSQDPAAGVVMIPGTAVNLFVSKGPQPVAVPAVAGMTQADAQTAITGAGLTVGTVTQQYSDTVPEGNVISQDPAAGTLLPPGTSVNLVLATSHLSLCDYYPLAVGNTWTTSGTTGNNGTSTEISDAFVVNGFQCWKSTSVNHATGTSTDSYVANANGWMYSYKTLDDLFLLPVISPNAQKIGPLSVTPGVPFVTNYGGTSLTVTPAKGKLSDFVSDTSQCPFGDVQDTVALKLGNFVLLVLGRDLGPLYFNYLTSSGFYTTITIVGGCTVVP